MEIASVAHRKADLVALQRHRAGRAVDLDRVGELTGRRRADEQGAGTFRCQGREQRSVDRRSALAEDDPDVRRSAKGRRQAGRRVPIRPAPRPGHQCRSRCLFDTRRSSPVRYASLARFEAQLWWRVVGLAADPKVNAPLACARCERLKWTQRSNKLQIIADLKRISRAMRASAEYVRACCRLRVAKRSRSPIMLRLAFGALMTGDT